MPAGPPTECNVHPKQGAVCTIEPVAIHEFAVPIFARVSFLWLSAASASALTGAGMSAKATA